MTQLSREKLKYVEPSLSSSIDRIRNGSAENFDFEKFPQNIPSQTISMDVFRRNYASNGLFYFNDEHYFPSKFFAYKRWYEFFADGLIPYDWINLNNFDDDSKIVEALVDLEEKQNTTKKFVRWPEEIINALVFHPSKRVLEMVASVFRLNIYQLAILSLRTEANSLKLGVISAKSVLSVFNTQIQLGNHKNDIEYAIYFEEKNFVKDSYIEKYFISIFNNFSNTIKGFFNPDKNKLDKLKKQSLTNNVPNFLYDSFAGEPSNDLLRLYENGVLTYDNLIFNKLINEFKKEKSVLSEINKTEKYLYIHWLWRFAGIVPAQWADRDVFIHDVYKLIESDFVFPDLLLRAILEAPLREFGDFKNKKNPTFQ